MKKEKRNEKKKKYEAPVLKIFSDSEIEDRFGPAFACSPSPEA
ncbi:MAG: hypothetical protein ABIA04_14655 [Pseudomonadota bacterium]